MEIPGSLSFCTLTLEIAFFKQFSQEVPVNARVDGKVMILKPRCLQFIIIWTVYIN